MMLERVPLYVLAGGRSSRFGADKARALVRGKPLVLQLAEALRDQVESVTVVADREHRYADLGLRTIADRHPGQGPLAGLQAALLDQDQPDWLLLTSCDWLGLRAAWVEQLVGARRPDSRAVAFRGEHWEPLLALYHRQLRAEVGARLGSGQLALWRLLADLSATPLPLPPDWQQAVQVNRPEDLPPDPG